ncbi:monovalent cation/H+ antiporter complex subunit F [Anaerovorax sp. IOR16]|uniref:monovalent cation/H+ antiporter complex subunit F n=1 Tax=Anaerovorax sp. IOR16 TaxID=2773458 RepID=UPI0019D2689D|nr:monovalent cation/H+ antiporter complex subunit F [Anaerovorax sp. IOR16]
MINFLQDYPIINLVVNIVLILISISLVINLVTVVTGKTLADRVVGLDALGTQTLALIILYAFKHGTAYYMDAVLIISILGFVAMVVWSKYMQKGNVLYPLRQYPKESKNSNGMSQSKRKDEEV